MFAGSYFPSQHVEGIDISEIHARSGINQETVREILAARLINRILFGFIEEDLFVRDTSTRPPTYPGRMGLYGR